jgi:hypothetical protein
LTVVQEVIGLPTNQEWQRGGVVRRLRRQLATGHCPIDNPAQPQALDLDDFLTGQSEY